MKARGQQPRLNNAHSICFTLLTACFSRIRSAWWPGGYPPESQASIGPYSKLPGVRSAEARQLLYVLHLSTSQGSSNAAAAGSNARQQPAGRRYMFLDNADNINWPVLALNTYRWACWSSGHAASALHQQSFGSAPMYYAVECVQTAPLCIIQQL